MDDLDDLSFSLTETSPVQRSAFRAMVRGLFAHIDDGSRYEVNDISACGCSMSMPLHAHTVGHAMRIDLMVGKKVLVAALQSRIVRLMPNDKVACAFDNVTLQQEFTLDKLILEIQKRKIAQRKNFARNRDDNGETSGQTAT